MDSQRIRLSALGRDVKVGNLYNYHSDAISICNVRVPQESISITKKLTPETEWFHLPQSISLEYEALGINAHLWISIRNKKSANLGQLWFGDYVELDLSKENVRVTQARFVAQVTFFFRVCRRIEALCPKFIDSKLNEYQMESGGVATHLVEQVVYGAEFICCLQRTIDRQHETKENAERNLYLAAKEYFNQVFGLNNASPDLPAALDKVQCEILSSLNPGLVLEGSFQQFIQYLMDAKSFYKEDGHWKPIEITLRSIPEQMESRLRIERDIDAKMIRKMHDIKLERILNGNGALKVAHLKIFPQFQDVMYQFCYLLEPLRQKIKKFHETTPERTLEARQITDLLHGMMDWQIHRSSEMEKIFWLIEGIQLKMLDMAEIVMLTATNKRNRAKVFVLRAEFYPVPLIESIYAYIGNPSAISAPLPVLPVLSADKERLQKIREELQKFSAEAQSNSLLDQEELRHRYYIGITSEYPHLTDGTITTFGDFKKDNDSPRKQQQVAGIEQEKGSFSGSEVNLSTRLSSMERAMRDVSIKLKDTVGFAMPSESSAETNPSSEQSNNSIVTSPELSADMEAVRHQSSKSPQMNQANGLNQPDLKKPTVEEEETNSGSSVDCI